MTCFLMAYLIELNLTKTLRDNLIEPDRVDNWLLCQSFALQRGGWEEPSPDCWPVEGHQASTGQGRVFWREILIF